MHLRNHFGSSRGLREVVHALVYTSIFQESITAMLSAMRGEEERVSSIKENNDEEPEDPSVSLNSGEKTEDGTEQYSVNNIYIYIYI